MTAHAIFDRQARRRARDRAARSQTQDRWLIKMMAENIVDRLSDQKETPENALLIGLGQSEPILKWFEEHQVRYVCCDPGFGFAKGHCGVQADEDRLPFADSRFDLVIQCGTLDSVDDLPGGLLLSHRVLRPGGRIVGSILGGPSLSTFKSSLMSAEMAVGAGSASRFHPQLEIRALGDLLTRAGFVMPIVDSDPINVRYSSAAKLVSDLRSMALSNVLVSRIPLSRPVCTTLIDANSQIEDSFSLLNLVAWKAAQGEAFPVGPSGRYFAGGL